MLPDFESWVAAQTKQINVELDAHCQDNGTRLREAMRYSLLAGGKRIRPLLCRAAAEAIGGEPDATARAASALEMIHTFSLIHDDLPAMDDDDLRRGRPTCHKVYGEAIAILAGDALQALAFEVVAGYSLPLHELSRACGQMCAGQAADLAAEGQNISLTQLQSIHARKTGALLRAAVLCGRTHAIADVEEIIALETFGNKIGIAFQIVDDILDLTGDDATLGKPAGSDLKHDKATYPKLVGLEESKRLARDAEGEALLALERFGERGERLRQIARYIVERNT